MKIVLLKKNQPAPFREKWRNKIKKEVTICDYCYCKYKCS